MRHRVHGRKLGRTTAHRKALFRNQLTALFTHDRIVTTLAKAKELRPLAERMVTLARTGTLPARRKVLTMVPDKTIVTRLFDEIAPRFADRPGGYTRIMRLGRRRGDGAELAIIEFVDYELQDKGDGGGGKKDSFMDRAKGMFGGGAKAGEADEADEAAEAPEVEAAEAETDEQVAAEPEPEKPKKKAAKKTKKAEPEPEPEKPKKAAKKTKKAEPEPEPEAEAAAEEEPVAEEAEAPAEEPAEEEKKKDK